MAPKTKADHFGTGLNSGQLEQLWLVLFGRQCEAINELQFLHAIETSEGFPEEWTYREKYLEIDLENILLWIYKIINKINE
ncbi:hypothetical protein Pmar_PMAR022870 [Perkinsus marinus ATCC 50983]|uniref:Uncharacterized protein n=1 Tax=Perkinsus marinus (strain ATCC 50983 / TXsc) TaxID=423536 RepID=C5KIF7_PERM5|nr:hypothetical protein Pmar_PMAR022870 [Perkinsus marinus ATCC 50983]EER15735.1 hypothetical protein Pmar_PMAR022870 [Perkinsus marinus ATCC 50983]|eukprot:XP_002783939.1 hypothetical protein Pmar_PMAR022870 [Perkinsus marinus ATCC 50983]